MMNSSIKGKFLQINDNMTIGELLETHPDDFTLAMKEIMMKYVLQYFSLNDAHKLEFLEVTHDADKIDISPNHPLSENWEDFTLVPDIQFTCGNMQLDVDKAMDIMDNYSTLCSNTYEPIWECNCEHHYDINYPEEVA